MDFSNLGGMVTPTMVALGKQSDRVHCRCLQGVLPFLFVEFCADPRDVRRGVEIKVDVAEAETGHEKNVFG
jgi:hypothetical protein